MSLAGRGALHQSHVAEPAPQGFWRRQTTARPRRMRQMPPLSGQTHSRWTSPRPVARTRWRSLSALPRCGGWRQGPRLCMPGNCRVLGFPLCPLFHRLRGLHRCLYHASTREAVARQRQETSPPRAAEHRRRGRGRPGIWQPFPSLYVSLPVSRFPRR